MKSKLIYLYMIFCLLVSSCKSNYDKVYYENNSLKYEVPLEDGLNHGKMIEYYPDGTVQSTSYWKNGKMEGIVLDYYPNGSLKLKSFRKNDTLVGDVLFYREDGKLHEKHIYDEQGRLYDFYKYDSNGNQSLDIGANHALFINDNHDTIKLGETYKSKIRLGNRFQNRITIHIIDTNLKYADLTPTFYLKNFTDKSNRLKNIDTITAYLEYTPQSIGVNKIKGIIYEIEIEKGKDSTNFNFIPIPFMHKFVVKP